MTVLNDDNHNQWDDFDEEEEDIDTIVGIIRYKNQIHWYRCSRFFWILDIYKRRDAYHRMGRSFDCFDSEVEYRFGMPIVNEDNVEQFLAHMADYEINHEILRQEFQQRYAASKSWWNSNTLFPVVFADFDRRDIAVCYPDGIEFERYAPDGWTGEGFVSFVDEYPEEIFPVAEKFWIQDGINYYKLFD